MNILEQFNPIIYSNSVTPEVYFVTANYYTDKQLEVLNNYIEKTFGDLHYQVIYGLNQQLPQYWLQKKGVKKSIIEYGIDLSKYVPRNSKVIAIGHGSTVITHNTDINHDTFTDVVFNKRYFYAPEIFSYVWRIDEVFIYSYLDQSYPVMMDNWNAKFTRDQIEEAILFSPSPLRLPVLEKNEIETMEELYCFYEQYRDTRVASLDLESSGLVWYKDKIVCVTMSFDGVSGYYIPWELISQDKQSFSNFLEDKYLVMANGKFDCKFLRHKGISTARVGFDTYLAGHALNEIRSNSLKTHSWIYSCYGGYEKPLDSYKRNFPYITYDRIPKNILLPYAIMDAIVTFQVYESMEAQLRYISDHFQRGAVSTLHDYVHKIMFPAIEAFIEIERKGMVIDWERVVAISKELQGQLDDLEAKICKKLGIKERVPAMLSIFGDIKSSKTDQKYEVSLFSGAQLGAHLEKLGWRNHGKSSTKTPYYLVNKDTLEMWASEGHLVAKDIDKLHELSKLISTYLGFEKECSGFWKYRYYDSVYPNFFLMTASSGRNRCKAPNLQNIPKHGDKAEIIRGVFTTPLDKNNNPMYLVEADGAGLQLRICASLSGDREMKRIFTELGGDMHSMTAVDIFCEHENITEYQFITEKGEPFFYCHLSEFDIIRDGQNKTVRGNEIQEGDKIQLKEKSPVTVTKIGVIYEGKVTLEKFMQYKKTDVYIDFRFRSKAVSFSLIFNTTAYAFAQSSLVGSWTEKQAEWYIRNNALDKLYATQLYKVVQGNEPDDDARYLAKCWTCAIDIKKKFFKRFTGVRDWIDASIQFANNNGYILCAHGAIRRLPELLYQGMDTDKRQVKNLQNIACNSPVQNFEAVMINSTITKTHSHLIKEKADSSLCGSVHDSILAYVPEYELDMFMSICKKHFEEDLPENNGIPMELEGEYSDVGKGIYWGFGKSWFKDTE